VDTLKQFSFKMGPLASNQELRLWYSVTSANPLLCFSGYRM